MADWFDENSPPQATQPQSDWFAQNAPKPVATEERSIPSKIGHAVLDTVKGFLPQSVEDAALAPVTMFPGVGQAYKSLSNIAFGRPASEGISPVAGIPVVQRIPEIIQAEKTPALSQERFTTGAGVVADLAMIAGFKGALHPEVAPKLAEVAGIAKPEVPPETVTPEPITPVATDTAATQPVVAPEVAPSVPAAPEASTAAPLPTYEERLSAGSMGIQPEVLGKVEPVAPDLPTGTGEGGQDITSLLTETGLNQAVTNKVQRTLQQFPAETEVRFTSPRGESLVSRDPTTGKWRVTDFARDENGNLTPQRHDLFDSWEKAVSEEAGNLNTRAVSPKPSPVSEAPVSITATPLTQTVSTEGGIENASKITSTESTTVPEVRQEVGGEAPLRQQGTTAEARQEVQPTAAPQEQVIPEGAKANVTVRDANGEPVQLQNVDAKQWEAKFTERKSAYQNLLDCLG